jgi:hypothetical protein
MLVINWKKWKESSVSTIIKSKPTATYKAVHVCTSKFQQIEEEINCIVSYEQCDYNQPWVPYLLTVIQTENFFGILISTRLFPIPKHSLHDCNLLYVSPSFTFYASLIFCVCSCCQMTPLVYAFSSFLYPFTMLFVDLITIMQRVLWNWE